MFRELSSLRTGLFIFSYFSVLPCRLDQKSRNCKISSVQNLWQWCVGKASTVRQSEHGVMWPNPATNGRVETSTKLWHFCRYAFEWAINCAGALWGTIVLGCRAPHHKESRDPPWNAESMVFSRSDAVERIWGPLVRPHCASDSKGFFDMNDD